MSTRVKGFQPKAKPVVEKSSAQQVVEKRSESDTVADNAWRRGIFWFITAAIFVIPFGWTPGYMHPYNKAFYLIILVAAISVIALWWAIGKKAIKPVYTPFFLGIGAWLLAKLITTFTSMLPTTSFWGSYTSWSDGFVYAVAVSVLAAVIINLRLDTKKIAQLIHILGLQAAIFGFMTIVEAIQEGFFYQKVRPDSPLLNADFFLSYTLLFWPISLALLFVNLKNKRWIKSIPYVISSLVLSGALFVVLPTHLQTILLPSFESHKKDTTFGATDTKSITASNFTEDTANMERWAEWKLGFTLGADSPLVGTGPSTTANAFVAQQKKLDLSSWDHDRLMANPHNDLIEQFSQEGLIGILAYLFLWATLIWVAVKNRHKIEPAARPYAIGVGLGLVFWFGFNQLLFTTIFPGLIEWTWIGLLIAMLKSAKPTGSVWAKVTVGVVSIGLAIISIFAIHGYIDDAYVFNAESVNTGIKSGADNALTTDEIAAAAKTAAAQQDAAADDLPYQGYYSNDAALSSIDLYIDFPSDADRATQAANALRYARQAVADDPYAPGYIETLGGLQYYLAAPGSSQETAGIALMNKAISLTPDAVGWYSDAAAIAVIKKDYSLARSFDERGLKVAKGTDRAGLESNLARLGS